MNKYVVEFLGTFFLVLTVALSGNIFAIGAVLAAAIYLGGSVSGAHYNPAVSLAVWMQKKLSNAEFGQYVLFQMLGGLVAAAVAYFLVDSKFLPTAGQDIDWWKAVLAEGLFTFLLALTVLQVAIAKSTQGNQYFGLAIALTVIAGGLSVGAISGAAFNPAVGVSPLLFDLASINDHWSNIALYLVGPLAGGALASLVYGYIQGQK